MSRRLPLPLTLALLSAAGLLFLATRPPAWGQALVADLSSHLIAITTGFTGTDVVLFGAVDGEGDVAVVVQGPEAEVTVRHKERVAGIWINTDEVEFARVPSFYSVAVSAPLEDSVPAPVLQRHEIGLDFVRLVPKERITDAERLAVFRTALIRNKQRIGLYTTESGEVSFLGQRLFRTRIYFPANVPTGTYTASVFLIRDGDVVSAQTTPLLVSKIGFSANVAEFAQRQSVFYAVLGIMLAVSLGWLAGIVFRKA